MDNVEVMMSRAIIERLDHGFRTWCWRCREERVFRQLPDAHQHCLHHECAAG
jgi:hypothetical protein